MPRYRDDDEDFEDVDWSEYLEDYTEDEIADMMELFEEFGELDDFFDNIESFDEGDFYGTEN